MSGHIHSLQVLLKKTQGPHQLWVEVVGEAAGDPPHSDLPHWDVVGGAGGRVRERERDTETHSLGGSIKNYISIHDVYQSKSGASMSSALLILRIPPSDLRV